MFDSKPIEFIKGTLRDPAAVGSIFPSSRYVAREYLRGVEFDEQTSVLELGPGTGPITELLYERMDAPGRYVGIEQDSGYVGVLEERFPEMHFVEGSAEDAVEYVEEVGLEDVDLIISALPFTTLPEPVQTRIYDQIDELMGDGTIFRAIVLATAYPTSNSREFRDRMNQRFGPFTKRRFVWRNIPPAFILTWRR